MRPTNRTPRERALDLACDRALAGLDPAEEAELAALVAAGHRVDPALELAAAAIVLADTTTAEPLPRHLAERALAAASQPRRGLFEGPAGTLVMQAQPLPSTGQGPALQALPPAPAANVNTNANANAGAPVTSIASARRRPVLQWLPWVAAAACLAIAVGTVVVRGTPGDGPSSGAGLATGTLAQERARLLAEAPDTVTLAWGATDDPAGKGESGDLVWSNTRQQGYMTFRALAANDPSKSQYQLWIFDGTRDERYPVDGGVFDVDPSKGEVIIPITARVRVSDPTLFAVTVEAPGGVVVSKRERIVVVAKVAG